MYNRFRNLYRQKGVKFSMNNDVVSELNFSKIEILRQSWQRGSAYSYIMQKRSFCGLLFVIKGKIEYKSKNKCIAAQSGDIVIIKNNSHYSAAFTKENVEDILINFKCSGAFFKDVNEDITIIKNRPDIGEYFSDILSFSLLENRGFMVKSILYNILDCIMFPNLSGTLAEEIKCLLDSDTSFNLSEKELAKKCAVSISTMQRSFKKSYGKTITAYRNELKISKAKRLLLSGKYSIEEISEALNYCDCSHFSKSFKSQTGISPKKYMYSSQKSPFF